MKSIKLYYLIAFLLIVSKYSYSQIKKGIIMDKEMYILELIDKELFMNCVNNDTVIYIRTFSLIGLKNVLYTDLSVVRNNSNYSYSLNWNVLNNFVYICDCRISTGKGFDIANIKRIEINELDTTEYVKNEKRETSEFIKTYPDMNIRTQKLMEQRKRSDSIKNFRLIKPLGTLLTYLRLILPDYPKQIEITDITYDFIAKDTSNFVFFIRTDSSLSVWNYNYPHPGIHSKIDDWSEIVTYSIAQKGSYKITLENPFSYEANHFLKNRIETRYLPSGKKHTYTAINDTAINIVLTQNSFDKLKVDGISDSILNRIKPMQDKPYIDDLCFDTDLKKFIGEDSKKYYSQIKDAGLSLFFKGHFHAFNYFNENFLINLNFGGIYWLAPKAIYRVGQIDVENYPKKLLNQKLFIEDKDNEQLIFFAPVKRLTQDKPFPKIKVLTDSEFNDLFKYVLDN